MLIRAALWLVLLVLPVVPTLGQQPALADPLPLTEQITAAPPDTINEFLPEDRSIGDCISALPKPGCGSEARGGWHQDLVLLAILGGVSFIAWRVVRSARKVSRTQAGGTA